MPHGLACSFSLPLVMRGKEKPSGKYDMLEVVQVVPRKDIDEL